jgi:hypothetical protein
MVRTFRKVRYTRGLGWRIHFGVEVTESSTNKQHHHITWHLGIGREVWGIAAPEFEVVELTAKHTAIRLTGLVEMIRGLATRSPPVPIGD